MSAEPDLSEFVALTRGRKRKPCLVAEAAATLPPQEAKQLEAAIAATESGPITVSAVLEWLKQRDHVLQQNHISRHRARRCPCHD